MHLRGTFGAHTGSLASRCSRCGPTLRAWSAHTPVKRLKPIAALVLPPAITVLTCGYLVRRFPLLPAVAFVVPVAVTVIAVIVVTVVVALRQE